MNSQNNTRIFIVLVLVLSIFSCNKEEIDNTNKKGITKEVKLTPEEINEIRKRAKKRQKKVVRVDVGDKKLIVGLKRLKKADETIKNKSKEGIKDTLRSLKLLKAQKETYKARNYIIEGNNKKVNLHFYDELKHCLSIKVQRYSLRNLKFKNDMDKIYLNTITFGYEYDKKRIYIEILDSKDSEKIIEEMKNVKGDFLYKKYHLIDTPIHVTVSYKYKIMNILYLHNGYRWNVTVKNDVSEDFLEVIKSINYERFEKLKNKYDR